MAEKIVVTPQALENAVSQLRQVSALFEGSLSRVNRAVDGLSNSWRDELYSLALSKYDTELRGKLSHIPKTLDSFAEMIAGTLGTFEGIDRSLRDEIWGMEIGAAAVMALAVGSDTVISNVRERLDANETIAMRQPENSRYCVLYSLTMLMRRRQILNGEEPSYRFEDIHELNRFRTAAAHDVPDYWRVSGPNTLRDHYNVPDVRDALIKFLDEHPEGIVAHFRRDGSGQHAVLITDFDPRTNSFYVSDPGNGAGRQPLQESTLITNYTRYRLNMENIWDNFRTAFVAV